MVKSVLYGTKIVDLGLDSADFIVGGVSIKTGLIVEFFTQNAARSWDDFYYEKNNTEMGL